MKFLEGDEIMKVLITGAGGNLGRVLAPTLEKNGHEPIMMDYRNINTPYTFILGDITKKEDVLKAVIGVDAIVHAAALHGIHLDRYSRDDFWQLNVEGTLHVYEAAKECGIKKVLLCSTMGVYGDSIHVPENSFGLVSEKLPLLPRDFYGLSKKLSEEIAHFYSRTHGIHSIVYRLGMFVPENFIHYGFRLLKGGVDDRDVAQAFLLGLQNQTIQFDTFNIMSEVPFTEDQFYMWRKEPKTLVESYFPEISTLFEKNENDLDELLNMWGNVYWSIEKAKNLLGYRPKFNFPEFYAALKEGNDAHYPYSHFSWWGI
jgi:UDP-glucose 4-epimerase